MPAAKGPAILPSEGGKLMGLTRKDVVATVLTALVVVVFAATHEGWGVPLIGDGHRWAAGAIMLLGIGTCAQGTMTRGFATRLLALLGIAALVLGVLAIATGSLTALSLLVLDIVALWAASTLRHIWQEREEPHAPVPA
jgi:hypothetical protein